MIMASAMAWRWPPSPPDSNQAVGQRLDDEVQLPLIHDGALRRPGVDARRLEAAPDSSYHGWLGPTAELDVDTGTFVYTGASAGTEQGWAPQVRLLRGDREVVVGAGGYAAVLGAERLAYAQLAGEQPDADLLAHVVVATLPAPDGSTASEIWTTRPGHYITAAWAGDRVLYYELLEGEHPVLRSLAGPGQETVLADGGTLIAVSPDGTRVVVEDGTARTVRLLDAGTGATLDELDLTTGKLAAAGVEWLSYAGDWQGDRVVARGAPGLVLFRVRDDDLQFLRTLPADERTFPAGVQEPQFAGDGDIVAWALLPIDAGSEEEAFQRVPVRCSSSSGSCRLPAVVSELRVEDSPVPVRLTQEGNAP